MTYSDGIYVTSYATIDFTNETINWNAGKFSPKRNNLIKKLMKSPCWNQYGDIQTLLEGTF